MSYLYVLLASIVEGITEFLPISSTGHLIILNHILQIQSSDLLSSFNIFIQLGAILAVLNLYAKDLQNDKGLLLKLFASFIPTAIIGFIFYPLIKKYLLDNLTVTAASLFIGGLVILMLPTKPKTKTDLSLLDYFKIGVFQSFSIIPGTSRALMSIVGGIYTGMGLVGSIKYSFLLAIPTILAATTLDLLKNKDVIFSDQKNLPLFLAGFCLSFLTAKLTLNHFISLSEKVGLTVFGYYRILLSAIILIFLVLL